MGFITLARLSGLFFAIFGKPALSKIDLLVAWGVQATSTFNLRMSLADSLLGWHLYSVFLVV